MAVLNPLVAYNSSLKIALVFPHISLMSVYAASISAAMYVLDLLHIGSWSVSVFESDM